MAALSCLFAIFYFFPCFCFFSRWYPAEFLHLDYRTVKFLQKRYTIYAQFLIVCVNYLFHLLYQTIFYNNNNINKKYTEI